MVPQTLRPLLGKRVAIKGQLAQLNRRDCRYRPFKARADALKWLLVVCFGYLGYKNARFGRIESHEAVTAYGREALLRAKEAAEYLGFTVLHMYVDGIWVQQTGHKQPADFATLQAEIQTRTGLPIALEGYIVGLPFYPPAWMNECRWLTVTLACLPMVRSRCAALRRGGETPRPGLCRCSKRY